ncbi:MAG: hypothetical protein MHM6MM_008915, partial [Cercozoa sp. M6MM]
QLLDALIDLLYDAQKDIRLQADQTLETFRVQLLGESASTVSSPPERLVRIARVLVRHCLRHKTPPIARLTALRWLDGILSHERVGGLALVSEVAPILSAVLHSMRYDRHAQQAIRKQAEHTSGVLMKVAREGNADASALLDSLQNWLPKLSSQQQQQHQQQQPQQQQQQQQQQEQQRRNRSVVHLHALRWLSMLLKLDAPAVLEKSPLIQPRLFDALCEEDDNVVEASLEVLAGMCNQDDALFCGAVRALLALFRRRAELLEHRGSLIVQRLAIILGGERIYVALSQELQVDMSVLEEREFASVVVQALCLILMTAPALRSLRDAISKIRTIDVQHPECTLFLPCSCLFPALFLSLCV